MMKLLLTLNVDVTLFHQYIAQTASTNYQFPIFSQTSRIRLKWSLTKIMVLKTS